MKINNKIRLTLCGFYLLTATSILYALEPLQVFAGQWHTCAIDKGEVKCWGKPAYKVPKLVNPRFVATKGCAYYCALDDEGLKCWSENPIVSEYKIPKLINPRQVTMGNGHACALDDEGVKCWGDNNWDVTIVPKLKKPTLISAGVFYSCALDDGKVKCWGKKDLVESFEDAPKLNNPKIFSTGYFGACVLDDDGVKCWGEYSDLHEMPYLLKPTQISVGAYQACALDAEGVKCWGGGNNHGESSVPILKNPTFVSAGYDYSCAVDAEGVKCWGQNEDGQTNVPEELKYPSLPSSIASALLKYISKRVYLYHAVFYGALFKINEEIEIDNWAKAFLIGVVGIDVAANKADFFKEEIIPKYIVYRDELMKNIGVFNISQIPKSQNILTASIALTKGVLLTSKQILNAETSQEIISEYLVRLGKIEADPQITKMHNLLNDMTEFSKKLSENQKLFGMSQVLVALNSYFNQ